MPEIVVKYEDKIIERVVSEKKRISIGRTHDNDIVLDNRGVSRKHAQIEFNDNAAVIIDNESLNGTFVNNRKISEELLRDGDTITIGKYSLTYHTEVSHMPSNASMDGTMVLNTKKQKDLLQQDKFDREIVIRMGGSVLVGEENTDFSEYPIERNVTTIGKAKFVHIHARGFMLSGIQAKIVKENEQCSLVNLGRKGKVKLNGEDVESQLLKNGDIVQVGKSVYRFVEGRQ
ncbi:MAG: FHA domain-containing protein [candidate division Zixibacteria bacterium]|nr:FHA domain-containing protein [candidate division Zixibacteria bacterium]